METGQLPASIYLKSIEEVLLELMDLGELRALVENLVSSAQTLQETIDRNYMNEHLRELLGTHYDIGELNDIKKLDRGYVNVSYVIETLKGSGKHKYYLRRYKRGIREEEIRFEHSIVKHLMNKDFTISADIIFKKDGSSYVKEMEGPVDQKEEAFYAVFEFLRGEDKYTWDNPVCTDYELKEAAGVLAKYHNTINDLRFEGRRYEPQIIDLLPTIAGNLMKYAKRTGMTKFDSYFLKNLDSTLGVIDNTLRQINRNDYNKMPHLAVHCDYHPGNLKFLKGRVVGLFDFDWSKIDVRCFDVALAITYACTTWEGKEDGDLLPEQMQLFLSAYQQESEKHGGIGPLKDNEVHYLPLMIKASNLYILNWDVDDYYIKKPNPYEYLIYLQHNVRVMRWIENNWDHLVYKVEEVLKKRPL